MCGIIGIIGASTPHQRINSLSILSHRGPDGHGQWQSKNGMVWIGHHRLAVIDPDGGKQPLSNETGTKWVTFNGCIYNYLELSQTLRKKGHRFETHSDTEVIIHAYEEWGEACVERFIGMFAFAIWDDEKKVLFCARDRLGIKPFYYWRQNSTFVFASEIKAILAANFFSPSASIPAMQEYLTFQAPISNRTLFKNIFRLLPGHCMIVNAEGSILDVRKYWDLSFDQDTEHDAEYFVDYLRLLLKDAVKIRLRSDVPLGTHLSGGLDSSTVTCLAAGFYASGEPLKTFTGAFDEGKEFDEIKFARLVVESAGTESYLIRPTATDFQELLPEIIYYMDEPSAGPGVFPQFLVSKLAAEHVKVVLGGQGGDEIFAGYARYLVGYLEECLKGAIEKTADTAHYAATLSSIIPSLPMLQQYTPMLRMFWAEGLFDSQENRYYRLMDRSGSSRDIFNPDVFSDINDIREAFKKIFLGSDAASFLNRMLYFDLKVHLPALLHVEDRTSMAWGLESRVPLLDHRICEFIAKVPTPIKFKNGQPKYLFRKAIKNIIPDMILNREDKMGFPVPLQKWYHHELRDFINDILLGERARQRGVFSPDKLEKVIASEQNFGRGVWGALCLELWFRRFIDGQANQCTYAHLDAPYIDRST